MSVNAEEKCKLLTGELLAKGAIQKKEAARIVHEFLRRELKEPDEADGSPAYRLRDLFDCRVCAGHIIQVYVKGIMDGQRNAEGSFVFNAEKMLSKEETAEIITRVLDRTKRTPRVSDAKMVCTEVEKVSLERALQMYNNTKHTILVDVRSQREYETGCLDGAVNIPLLQLIKNPYRVSGQRNVQILLYCEEGYQSEAAARCLLEAGYERVVCFAWRQKCMKEQQ